MNCRFTYSICSPDILWLYGRLSTVTRPPTSMSNSEREDEAADGEGSPPRSARPGSPATLRRFVVWTLVGIAIGLVVMLLVLREFYGDPTPPLAPAIFEAAHERWKEAAP